MHKGIGSRYILFPHLMKKIDPSPEYYIFLWKSHVLRLRNYLWVGYFFTKWLGNSRSEICSYLQPLWFRVSLRLHIIELKNYFYFIIYLPIVKPLRISLDFTTWKIYSRMIYFTIQLTDQSKRNRICEVSISWVLFILFHVRDFYC
jgi:hypothetical protein